MYEMKKENPPAVVIKNATFITSAARADQFIKPDKPMIAVCGKSNVGKSSFINMLANRKKLAKTSSEPGRTRLVNYFDFGEFILADLPGYGFARVSKGEKEKWAKTLDSFFQDKEKISSGFSGGAFLCVSNASAYEMAYLILISVGATTGRPPRFAARRAGFALQNRAIVHF